jgi:hypothetical protein
MFGFTKVVKLVGLFRKNPSDIVFLPVSIVFGYFHGLIKLWALFTLKQVYLRMPYSSTHAKPYSDQSTQTSWGSREDGDEHNTFRLQEKPPRSQSMATPPFGPDLPKAMQHHPRFSQARRAAISAQKRELMGCTAAADAPSYPKTTKPPPIH